MRWRARRWGLAVLAAVATAAATVAPALAQNKQAIPLQLESVAVPVEVAGGSVGRGYISIFLEVPNEASARRLCNLLPKVHDAISLTFEGRPVQSADGTYDLADQARRLRQRLNAAFGEPIVLRLYLRQGLSRMAAGDMLRLHGNIARNCRALKVLPWETHLLEQYQTEQRAAGAAVLAKRSEDDADGSGAKDDGRGDQISVLVDSFLDVLLTPAGLFLAVIAAGGLLLSGGLVGWLIARRRRIQRRRERRRRRDRRGVDRRAGVDRRQGEQAYDGPERRTSEDRRAEERRTGERREGDRRADATPAAPGDAEDEVEEVLEAEKRDQRQDGREDGQDTQA